MKQFVTRFSAIRRSQLLSAAIAVLLSLSVISAPQSFAADKQSAKHATKSVSVKKQKVTRVNINSASIKDLVHLKGIGEKKAIAIVQYRNAKGKFKKLEQLTEVKGIGLAIVEKNRKMMTL